MSRRKEQQDRCAGSVHRLPKGIEVETSLEAQKNQDFMQSLDLGISELDSLAAPNCTPDVDPKWCDVAVGAAVSLSIASIAFT